MRNNNKEGRFSREKIWLTPGEYGKICSEINSLYYSQYEGKRIAAHPSFGIDGVAYIYWFENHGFNDYNFFLRAVNYC